MMRDNYMIYYLEELIFTALESTALLTIVHKNGSVIDHRHLSEALLGVQKHIENREDANSYEGADHNVILLHRVVNFLASFKHSY